MTTQSAAIKDSSTSVGLGLAGLYPELRRRAEAHIAALEGDGFRVLSVVGLETLDEREELWRSGRALKRTGWEVVDPGKVLTYSQTGWHPFGLAYDLVLTAGGRQPRPAAWRRIRELGERAGVQSEARGGRVRWGCVHHFQLAPRNMTPRDARVLLDEVGNLAALWRRLGWSKSELG